VQSVEPHVQFTVLAIAPTPFGQIGYFRQSLLVAVQYKPVTESFSHALDPQAQLDGFACNPLERVQVGTVKTAQSFEAWLQYIFDAAQKLGVSTLPQAQGAVFIVKPFSLPHAQHLGASVTLTHGSLSHVM